MPKAVRGVASKKLVRLPQDRGGCWEWQGRFNINGTPQKKHDGVEQNARRWVWEMFFGAIPKGKRVLSKCGNLKCINLGHLELGDAYTSALARASTKLSRQDADEIRAKYDAGIDTESIAEEYGISQPHVCRIGLRQMHKGKEMTFRPMKGDDAVRDRLQFPYMLTPKIDGYRCVVRNGVALTSSLKPFPNKYLQKVLGVPECEGFDGELVIGNPTDSSVFRNSGALRKIEGEPDFGFFVFDDFSNPHLDAHARFEKMQRRIKALPHGSTASMRVIAVPVKLVQDEAQLEAAESKLVAEGYEGVMLRQPNGPYKYGRSTVKENLLLKVKTFLDGEAVIIGFEEQMLNTNEKVTDANGRSKRSSAKAGKVGKGTLGNLLVRGINGKFKDVEFEVGTGEGLTHALRQHIWNTRERFMGKVITYKSQDVGGYDKPRIPVYKGFRDPAELT